MSTNRDSRQSETSNDVLQTCRSQRRKGAGCLIVNALVYDCHSCST